jgi:hypothetical protein
MSIQEINKISITIPMDNTTDFLLLFLQKSSYYPNEINDVKEKEFIENDDCFTKYHFPITAT